MIVKCEECKTDISDTAKICPKCGRNRVVNLLPYQMVKCTDQWESLGCNLSQYKCPIRIPNCPSPVVCAKCENLNNCIAMCHNGVAVAAAITVIFLIVAFVAVAIGIIFAASGC